MATNVFVILAAVATATAVVFALMLRSAKRDLEIARAQVTISNDVAESATQSVKRMQTALRVYSEEVGKAKAEREATDKVIREAEKVLASGDGLEGLEKAWDEFLAAPDRS